MLFYYHCLALKFNSNITQQTENALINLLEMAKKESNNNNMMKNILIICPNSIKDFLSLKVKFDFILTFKPVNVILF